MRRPLPAALARAGAARRNGRGLRRCNSDGKIRHWGVSNLDPDQMKVLWAHPGGRRWRPTRCSTTWAAAASNGTCCRGCAHRIPVMAYSPFEQGRLVRKPRSPAFARKHAMTPAQVALAWLLAQDGVIAIPKTASVKRLEENAAALERRLTQAQLRELDSLFPPPDGPSPLGDDLERSRRGRRYPAGADPMAVCALRRLRCDARPGVGVAKLTACLKALSVQTVATNRDRGRPAGRTPPTPPGMRVRTGRFEKLRSGEFGHSKAIEVGDVQHPRQAQLQCHRAAWPCDIGSQRPGPPRRRSARYTVGPRFHWFSCSARNRRAATDPARAERRGLCQAGSRSSTRHVAPQFPTIYPCCIPGDAWSALASGFLHFCSA